MTPAAVVFDNDGLTLDTEQAWTRAEELLFRRYGSAFTDDHKRDLLGSSRPVAAAKLEGHCSSRPVSGLALVDELLRSRHGRARPRRAADARGRRALGALRAAGTPVGLASNSARAFVDKALAVAGLEGLFDVTVAGDEVAGPSRRPTATWRPPPRWAPSPAACVALEDSRTGVAAARAAGMTVIGVPSFPGVVLDGADLVAESLRDPRVAAALGLRAAA